MFIFKPLKTLAAIVLMLTIMLLPYVHAQIPSVVTIMVKGQSYQLIELIEHNNRWYKREKEYWIYKQLDSIYPLTIHKEDYQANKALLKYVPDHRDFYTKHPYVQKTMFLANIGSVVLNILLVVHI